MKLVRTTSRLEAFLEKAEFYLGFNPLKVVCIAIAFASLFFIGAFTGLLILNALMEIYMENNYQ